MLELLKCSSFTMLELYNFRALQLLHFLNACVLQELQIRQDKTATDTLELFNARLLQVLELRNARAILCSGAM